MTSRNFYFWPDENGEDAALAIVNSCKFRELDDRDDKKAFGRAKAFLRRKGRLPKRFPKR